MTSAHEIYDRGIVPPPFTVLGQRLRPYSFGHAVLLSRLGVDRISSFEDLKLAVLICSRSFAEFEEGLESWWHGAQLKIWGLSCERVRASKEALESHIKEFSEYLRVGTSRPSYELISSSDEDGQSATPMLQHLRATLLSKLNYRQSELYDAPYTQCIWDYLTYWEIEGKLRITDGEGDEKDRDIDRKVDQAKQDMAEGFEAAREQVQAFYANRFKGVNN